MQPIWISPSMLASDFARLGEEARGLERAGADALHIDVMDGMYVPNITFGPCVMRALSGACALPLDVHMMVEAPERYIDDMVGAGARIVTVHAEATRHLDRTLQRVREHPGVRCGVALNPATSEDCLRWVLGAVDLVLLMTVNPGFGGQKLIPYTMEKIARVRAMLDAAGSSARLEVDGGVTPENAGDFLRAGADTLVSGTGIFRAPDRAEAIRRMRNA